MYNPKEIAMSAMAGEKAIGSKSKINELLKKIFHFVNINAGILTNIEAELFGTPNTGKDLSTKKVASSGLINEWISKLEDIAEIVKDNNNNVGELYVKLCEKEV